MSKIVYTGLESAGKSLILADTAISVLKRNYKWKKKYGFTRILLSNLKFCEDVEIKYKGFIKYWTDVRQIQGKIGIDIIWDEISTDLSAQKREPLPRKLNQWFRQGAKQGVHIYATAQEFHDIHLDFRRRVAQSYQIQKVLGSGRGGKALPDVKIIWGLCIKRQLDIHPYNELEPRFSDILPSPFFITRSGCSIFDTQQTIVASEEVPYEHIEYRCERKDCKDLPRHMRVKHR